jgi:uncharacterized protein (TIGR02145 family)
MSESKLNTSTIQSLMFLFVMILLSACSETQSPIDNSNNIDEESLDGSISGRIVDNNGQAIIGVDVSAQPGGYSGVSDSSGSYTVPKMERGVYTLSFTHLLYGDTSLAGVELALDQDLSGVNMVLISETSAINTIVKGMSTRSIEGVLLGSTEVLKSVARVEILATDTAGVKVPVGAATLSDENSQYAVEMSLANSGGSLYVKVFDSLGHLIGYHKAFYDNNNATLRIEEFAADNALPVIEISLSSNNIFGGDTVSLSLSVTDAFGGSVVSQDWDVGGAKLVKGSLSDSTIKVTWSSSQVDTISVLVKDNDGNKVEKQIKVSINGTTAPFVDSRDGETYGQTVINGQTWMTENLRFLPSVDSKSVGGSGSANYYVYDYDPIVAEESAQVASAKLSVNYLTHGVLYNQSAYLAVDLCPEGWHLPSMLEWGVLIDFVESLTVEGEAAQFLKSSTGWSTGGEGNDDYGFGSIPSGSRSFTSDGSFKDKGQSASYASSDLDLEQGRTSVVSLWYADNFIERYGDAAPEQGLSVRCILN